MTIDKNGKWWKGSSPQDLRPYLKSLTSDAYTINHFRLAKCDCGQIEFKVHADQSEGAARRTCIACRKKHFIGDSHEYWSECEHKLWKCIECKSHSANVGVGFFLKGNKEVRWIYVGLRCSKCGVLGCYTNWKIDYEPTKHLLQQV